MQILQFELPTFRLTSPSPRCRLKRVGEEYHAYGGDLNQFPNRELREALKWWLLLCMLGMFAPLLDLLMASSSLAAVSNILT
jgi:hypothetical protein